MILTPTLWRTSRVLAGPTRLDLLRRILAGAGPGVSEFAAAAGLSEPRASQELRRLQARGLVQMVREGRHVTYRPVPDAKVPSAKPLLAAAKAALAKRPDEETIRVAQAFGHDRRLRIVRELMNGPRPARELAAAAGIPEMALFRHLRPLKEGGVARRTKNGWELAPNSHPLAKAMKALLED
ncbi:MAG: ArsR family transcriptional regulator [Opitutae bacterium]|nr:ArsR family transcriptional regulator [Opitutae bacterium]